MLKQNIGAFCIFRKNRKRSEEDDHRSDPKDHDHPLAGHDSVTFTYDKRGNRVAEAGKKATEAYVYDATNHLVEGTNWQGDKSAYTYNGLFVRVRNTQTTHSGQVYDREFVIDYNSFERNDLMVFSAGYYEQKHIYTAWGERMEQFTERGNWDRLLYVHEDIMGNTRYYTKDNGQSFAELEYDVWGAVTSPSKLTNNDNGNFAAAVFTGHPYDTVLDIYFAEARFYDAKYRQWMASDPIKESLNWYWYANGNPATYWDYNGLFVVKLDENGKAADGTHLKPGANSDDVYRARLALMKANEINNGNYQGAFLKESGIMSQNKNYYDSDMEEAVRKYQEDHHLPSTGVIDPATWLKLGLDYNTTLQEEYGFTKPIRRNSIKMSVKENTITIDYFPRFYVQGQKATIDELFSMSEQDLLDLFDSDYHLPKEKEKYEDYLYWAEQFIKGIEDIPNHIPKGTKVLGLEVQLVINVKPIPAKNGVNADVIVNDKPGRAYVSYTTNSNYLDDNSLTMLFKEWQNGNGTVKDITIPYGDGITDFGHIAAHEFGHRVFGLGDAYNDDPAIDKQINVDSKNIFPDSLMRNQWNGYQVSSNDIEMILLAYSTGLKQHYTNGNLSEAFFE